MANETVLFKRGDSATITSTPVTDGQILFDTSGNGKMYLDNGTDRLEMGGAITVDASLSKTSTNAIQNKAVTGNILNSLAEVSAATQQNTIAGALALKEVNSSLGDISGFTNTTYDSIGDFIQYCVDNGYLPDVNSVPLIPTMTSNSAPSGVASQNSTYENYDAYMAFDGNDNTQSCTIGGGGIQYIQYKFDNPVLAKKCKCIFSNAMPSSIKSFEISASNDGSNFDTLYSASGVSLENNLSFDNNNYTYYRFSASLSNGLECKTIQLYGIK